MLSFDYFNAASYEETQGGCRNRENQHNDIFTVEVESLDECKRKCDTTPGCGAVSYKMGSPKCYGTSMKAYNGRSSPYNCYSKRGHMITIYNIANTV